MRIEKLTTQFQQALSDAQSLAVSADNPYMEPVHVLAAIIAQPDGSGRALLERAGVRISVLKHSVDAALKSLPQVSGQSGQPQVSRELLKLLNQAEKDAENAATSSWPSRCSCWPSPTVTVARAARPVGCSCRRD